MNPQNRYAPPAAPGHRGARRCRCGIMNFNAVWVSEKLATLTSFKSAARPAWTTSTSRILSMPLGYTTHKAPSGFNRRANLRTCWSFDVPSAARKIRSARSPARRFQWLLSRSARKSASNSPTTRPPFQV